MPLILFYAFAFGVVFSAVMVISMKNPVHAVLFLIFAFFNAAGLFLLIGAEFIAMMLVIVYVGAVAVLFLFVIMMLNLRQTEDMGTETRPISKLAKFSVSGLLLLEMLFVVRGSYFRTSVETGLMLPQADDFGSVETVAELLFTT